MSVDGKKRARADLQPEGFIVCNICVSFLFNNIIKCDATCVDIIHCTHIIVFIQFGPMPWHFIPAEMCVYVCMPLSSWYLDCCCRQCCCSSFGSVIYHISCWICGRNEMTVIFSHPKPTTPPKKPSLNLNTIFIIHNFHPSTFPSQFACFFFVCAGVSCRDDSLAMK